MIIRIDFKQLLLGVYKLFLRICKNNLVADAAAIMLTCQLSNKHTNNITN
jgi:hypothetical protein